jgi:hypothetical protein
MTAIAVVLRITYYHNYRINNRLQNSGYVREVSRPCAFVLFLLQCNQFPIKP